MKKLLLLTLVILSISWSYAQTLNVDNQTDCSCNGGSDGSIAVSTTGGTAPYSYEWDNGLSTDSVHNDLPAGTYSVTVTDNDNNTDSQSITINEPSAISITFSTVDVSCYGGNTGSIDLSVTGGTPGYTYNWDSGESTEDLSDLFSQGYSVTVTDANNCIQTEMININEPTEIVITSVQ